MNQFVPLTRVPGEGKKDEDVKVWVNLGATFYMETGVRIKDKMPYTVVHSIGVGEQKVIVKETPNEIEAMGHKVKEISIKL